MRYDLGTITGSSGTSTVFTLTPNANGSPSVTFDATGTFDSGTITFQTSPDGGTTWVAVNGADTLTADGNVNVFMNSSSENPRTFRASLASASGSADIQIYAWDSK